MIQILHLWSTVWTVNDKTPFNDTNFIINSIGCKIISTLNETGKCRQHLPFMYMISPLYSMVKNGKQHHICLIQGNISGFIEVDSTSGMYIINMLYILLNIIEMRGLMCSSSPGIDGIYQNTLCIQHYFLHLFNSIKGSSQYERESIRKC